MHLLIATLVVICAVQSAKAQQPSRFNFNVQPSHYADADRTPRSVLVPGSTDVAEEPEQPATPAPTPPAATTPQYSIPTYSQPVYDQASDQARNDQPAPKAPADRQPLYDQPALGESAVELPSHTSHGSGCSSLVCGGCQKCGCGPLWTARVGTVILERDRPDSFATLTRRSTGETLLDNDQFDFGYSAGVDVQLFRNVNEWYDLEFRYFGIDGWDSTLSGSPNVQSNINTIPPVLVLPGDFTSTYRSELFSTEMNLRRRLNDRWSVLAGFRYAELNEDVTSEFVFPATTDTYFINTDNRLYGFQLGADGLLWDRGGRLRVNSWVKAGIYYNDADHDSVIYSGATGTPLAGPVSDENETTAFLGEIAVIGTYDLGRNWAIYSGYQLLWVDGVAIAGDQVAETNFNTHSGIDTNGGAFYHGVTLGLQWSR